MSPVSVISVTGLLAPAFTFWTFRLPLVFSTVMDVPTARGAFNTPFERVRLLPERDVRTTSALPPAVLMDTVLSVLLALLHTLMVPLLVLVAVRLVTLVTRAAPLPMSTPALRIR